MDNILWVGNHSRLKRHSTFVMYHAQQLTFPTVSGNATVEKSLAFEVEGGGEALDYVSDLYPIWGQDVDTMAYTLVPSPDLNFRDEEDAVSIWTQRSTQVTQGSLNKPLLIVEGIDLSDDTHPYANYGRLGDLALQARNDGYDVAVISFQDPLSSIRQHEEVLRRALQLVHDLKGDTSQPTAVAGLSRGGVVARYALAKMEENGTPHHTSLFLSYDAPQRGGNINLNLQETLFGSGRVADNTPQEVKDRLSSQAVKELLIDHAEHNSPTEKEALFNEIRDLNGGIGYPAEPRLVTWSNGTWLEPSFDTNLAFEIVSNGDIRDQDEFELTNLDRKPGSYFPRSLSIDESGFVTIDDLDIFKSIGTILVNFVGMPFGFDANVPTWWAFSQRSDPTFIPTSSSTDKDSPYSSSPFDCVTGVGERSSHAAFTSEAATLMLDELRYAFGDASQPGNCESLPGPPLEVTLSGPSIVNSGQEGTWTADVEGGEGSTSYDWSVREPGATSWTGVPCSGQTCSYTFTNFSTYVQDVEIRVTVDKGSETDTDSQWVTVSPGAPGCEPWMIECPSTQLANLRSFEAEPQGEAAQLAWTTTGSMGEGAFLVQHRADSTAAWSDLQTVEVAEKTQVDSTDAPTYQLETDALAPGTHQFRLQWAADGETALLSDVVEAEITLSDPYRLRAYPNPVGAQMTVESAVKERQHVRVQIYDVLGRRVTTVYDGPMAPNEVKRFTVQPGADGLSSGTYFLRMTGEQFQTTTRISVVR
ncbi:hypothetical protein CRI93_14700 [Longimonas halophila]|uniref:Secretion system C-terminal sorting domain-containing protein n=2 Tax=Longimonas halophila TaxID=1469170 RepID=A0A2H3NHP4_9BACT|nr:hypothetical protein CRI93_14700 [Longimonas halophila]